MGVGILGGLAGVGQFGSEVAMNELKAIALRERDTALAEIQRQAQERGFAHADQVQERGFANEREMVGVREDSRQRGRQADIDQDTSEANVAAKAGAIIKTNELTLPSRIAEKTTLGAADTQIELERFTKLEPTKRKALIDAEVEKLKAMSTPEMLAASKKIALSKHIVDPSYQLIPNADGTVTTFDSRSGRSGGTLKDSDGNPIIRKDSEEMKAATAVINMANANLKTAEAAYKATMADVMADSAAKAASAAEWKSAQEEARRLTAPAYAVLYAKAGISDKGDGKVNSAAPYADGTELRGRDGKTYVVTNGQPVLKGAAPTKGIIGPSKPAEKEIPGWNVPLPRTTATPQSEIKTIEDALRIPSLTMEQRAQLSLRLQDAMRKAGVLGE